MKSRQNKKNRELEIKQSNYRLLLIGFKIKVCLKKEKNNIQNAEPS